MSPWYAIASCCTFLISMGAIMLNIHFWEKESGRIINKWSRRLFDSEEGWQVCYNALFQQWLKARKENEELKQELETIYYDKKEQKNENQCNLF